ncbi:hypothetical protein GQ54DRAFT_309285 [Martensiomyces pterosporus]|nr:hypothetical protein GQ54DRAFT_309285 [Martensiomyces pterosporus]
MESVVANITHITVVNNYYCTTANGYTPLPVGGGNSFGVRDAASPNPTQDSSSGGGDGGGGGKDSKGVDIHQIDLFSGVPALFALIVGFLQFLPDPGRGQRASILRFLRWLKTEVDMAFGISLYTCETKCHTTTFRVSPVSIEERAKSDIGENDAPMCSGKELLRIDDIIKIIQNGSGQTLIELARAARYPRMAEFEKAVRVISFVPSSGRRIIAWQWIHVGVLYFFSVLLGRFFSWVGGWASVLYHSIAPPPLHVTHRVGDTYVSKEQSEVDKAFKMSVLAQNKLMHAQLPWVQFGLYALCADLVGKRLTFRLRDRDEDNGWASTANSNEGAGTDETSDCPRRERRLLSTLYTDPCSVTQCMYAIGIQSIRIVMLAKHIGSAPLHAINGVWGSIRIIQGEGYTVFQHDRFVNNYLALFGPVSLNRSIQRTMTEASDIYGGRQVPRILLPSSDNLSLHSPMSSTVAMYNIKYNTLMSLLSSPLGDTITAEHDYTGILNLSFVDLSRRLDGKSQSDGCGEVFDVQISMDVYDKLCTSQDRMMLKIEAVLNQYMSWDIHWGISPCTLRLLYLVQHEIPYTSSYQEKHNANKAKTAILSMTGYRNKYNLWQNKVNRAIAKREAGTCKWNWLADKLFTPEAVTPKAYYVDNPEWCLCTTQCNGICTLLANNFDLFIPEGYFLTIPYLLASEARERTLVCTRDVKHVAKAIQRRPIGDSFSETDLSENVDPAVRLYMGRALGSGTMISNFYYARAMDRSHRPLVLAANNIFDLNLVPLNPYNDMTDLLDPMDPIIFLESAPSTFDDTYADSLEQDTSLKILRRHFYVS